MPGPPNVSQSNSNTDNSMNFVERAQMGWALRADRKRDKMREKYQLGPSKLGGRLAQARRERLENASVRSRMRMIARTVKAGVKDTRKDVGKQVQQAVSNTSKTWARFGKNVRSKFLNLLGRGPQHVSEAPREQSTNLPVERPPVPKLPGLQNLAVLKQMSDKNASEIEATFENGELKFESSKFSWGAAKAYFDKGVKSKDTVNKNARSIRAVLDYIEHKSGPEVRKLVENAYIRLDGDEKDSKFTVADRIKRGTFLSSDFVRKLNDAAVDAQRAVVMAHNQQAVDHFLSGKPSTALDKLPEEFEGTFSGTAKRDPEQTYQKSGLSKWIDDTIQSGGLPDKSVEEFPETYRKLKTAIDNETRKAPEEVGRDPKEPILGRFRKRAMALKQQADKQTRERSTATPTQLTDQNLREVAGKHFGERQLFNDMVNTVNEDLAKRYTENSPDLTRNLATAVRGYIAHNDGEKIDGITQEDCDWLADQIENSDYLDLPETSLVHKMFGFYDEKRDMSNIVDDLRQEIAQGVEEQKLSNQSRELDKPGQRTAKNLHRLLKRVTHAKEFKTGDFSRMLGPKVKEIIQERNRRLDQLNRKQAQFREKSEVKLSSTLSKFPDLQDAAENVKRGLYPKLGPGNVKSAGQFFQHVLEQDLQQEIPQVESLATLDDFAELQDQLVSISRQGGLDQQDPKVLLKIQETANELKQRVIELRAVGRFIEKTQPEEIENLVEDEDGILQSDPNQKSKNKETGQSQVQLKALGLALQSAADQIEQEIEPYLSIAPQVEAHRADRLLRHLPQVHQQHNVQVGDFQNNGLESLDSRVDPNSVDGKRPSHIVNSDFEKAFRETGMVDWKNKSRTGTNPMKAFKEFSRKQLPTLDEFAEFGLAHESATRLNRQVSEKPSNEEKLQLEQFERDSRKMLSKVNSLEKELGRLKANLENARPPKDSNKTGDGELPHGIPNDVRDLLDSLDETIAHMKRSLENREFIGTNSDSPDPLSGGGSLVRPWTDMSRKLENSDDIAQAFGMETYFLDEVRDGVENFREFDEALSENMDKHPVVSDKSVTVIDLGNLDIKAGLARKGLEWIDDQIGELNKLEEKIVNSKNPQPRVKGRWDAFADRKVLATEPQKAYLDNVRTLRDDLQAQRAHIANRLLDFEAYRGKQFPNAATRAAIDSVWQNVQNWSWNGGAFAQLVDGLKQFETELCSTGNENTTEAVKSAQEALVPGLKALRQILGTPDLASDPILAGPCKPTPSQLQSLTEKQQTYARDLEALKDLARRAEKVVSGLDDFTQTPGGIEWSKTSEMLKVAVDKASQRLETFDEAIRLARRKPAPLDSIPNLSSLESRMKSTRERISAQNGLAGKLAIDGNQLPEQPQRYQGFDKKRHDSTQPHHAMNAFLGANVLDETRLKAFQEAWTGKSGTTGTPGELPYAYLRYLNETGQSPHKVEFHAFDPQDVTQMINVRISGDRVLIGTQNPPGFRTFYKDERNQWRMFDPTEPLKQLRMDPETYLFEQSMSPDNDNNLVTVVTIGTG